MNEAMLFVCLFIYPLAVFFFALGKKNNVKRKKLLRQVRRFANCYLRPKVRSWRLNIGRQSSFLLRLWMETESRSAILTEQIWSIKDRFMDTAGTPEGVRYMGYWPSVRSRWLDTGQVIFCVFMDRDDVEVHKLAKKEQGQYPTILTEQNWSIKH